MNLYPIHALADVFPLLSSAEQGKLTADIRVNGQLEKVAIFENAILDGRGRAYACEKLNVPLQTEVLIGVDPIAYLLSKNALRRHLKSGQRALIAAKLTNTQVGSNQFSVAALPVGRAATVMGAGERSVHRAKAVLTNCDQSTIERVARGELTLTGALARLSPEKSFVTRDEAEAGVLAELANLKKVWALDVELRSAWNKASREARRTFAKEVLRVGLLIEKGPQRANFARSVLTLSSKHEGKEVPERQPEHLAVGHQTRKMMPEQG